MMLPFVLCSDLDRTLIPNGGYPESPQARPWLRLLCEQPAVTLVYVTGRDLSLTQQAIQHYNLPQPDYLISDVGSCIYQQQQGEWCALEAWQHQFAQDWQGCCAEQLSILLQDIAALTLQPASKQNQFKLSFYTEKTADPALLEQLKQRLLAHQIQANLIWSVDEQTEQGLLDVLPQRANKLTAIQYLHQHQLAQLPLVFAGDSGNDLPVLLSDTPAILVANADPHTREAALAAQQSSLYLARGQYLGLNGYYSAGVLEGLAHHFPEVDVWLTHLANTGADYV